MFIKHKSLWILLDSFLYIFYFTILGFIFHSQQERIYYLDGFNGTNFADIIKFFCIFAWLAVFMLYFLIIARVYFWKNQIINRRRLFVLRLLALSIIHILALAAMIVTISGKSRVELFMEGYRDWAKGSLEIEKIRTWVSTCDLQEQAIYSFFIDKDFEGPLCLLKHGSRFTVGYIRKEENGSLILDLHSGGGFRDWGIYIGPQNLSVPAFETVMHVGGYREYHLKLDNGAYVWHEL